METVVRLCDLTTGYKKKPVTSGISAELHAGEFACLLGPNGAGKSTLLKTLCAFMPPLSGQIYVNGKEIGQMSTRQIAQTIGVVLTERPQAMNMTVEELAALGRSPYTSFFGGLKAKDKEIASEAISMVGIDDLRMRNVATLSDGERQKAMIAKALAQQTEIIFLDEPTAFLDYPSKADIMKLLYRLAHDEGKTVFMSTHDLDIAIRMADKIWLLDKPHGLSIGTPKQLGESGLMGEYFDREGLRYNPRTATFEIDRE